uniref:Phosphofructokinase domain-containing protein n=1 Tax=Oryza rufipogon TaxID=4529 RepID=A0A0E0NK25_ORYRU
MDSDYGVPRELSEVQKKRALYQPELPPCLQGTTVRVEYGDAAIAADPAGAHVISHAFPHTYGQPLAHFLRKTANVPDATVISEHPVVRVGVVFCGRQSPGGHNVIWGLHEAIKAHNPNSKLIGFLGGSDGLLAQKTLEITDEVLSSYKNQGGYDMLGRTKDQIRTTEQVNGAMASCQALKLDALVIIGGVTSNTDAAQLAETFAEAKCATKVVGVPVTLNGDLKNQFVETTVGFDTICKVNSQLISNVCTDALSAEKYYYFIRMMGRKASHVALECALQSHPNMVILGEEVAASKLTIFDITKQICDAVQARAEKDKYHGVVLIPEGLVESIPELYALLQLLLHPESDDSAQLSQIETEKLLAQLVEDEMNRRMVLGHVCYHILAAGLNGYMATVTNLKSPANKWRCGAAPISSMMTVKRWSRGPAATQIGKPAVHMATVDLKGKAFELLRNNSTSFLIDDIYRNPGPLQFEGAGADSKPISLCVEDQDYMGRIKKLQEYLEKVKSIVKPGCSQDVLKAALSAMSSVTETLAIMTSSSTGQGTPL